MSKIFNCKRKAAAEKASATFVFTVDEMGFTHLSVSGKHSKNPDADVESKLYAECCKLQREMLNWQSRLMAESMGDGQQG